MLRYNRNSRLQEDLFSLETKPDMQTRKLGIQVFVKKWKLLAYHLEDLRVPLVVRVPQVGNPCFRGISRLDSAFIFLR